VAENLIPETDDYSRKHSSLILTALMGNFEKDYDDEEENIVG
jgi:hypothetical protein